VAQVLACSENQVRRWLHRYNAQGLAGLRDHPRSGRPSTLTAAQRALFTQRVRQARGRGGMARLRIADLQALLTAEFGAHYSRSGLYWLVHRLGLARVVLRPSSPRPEHPVQAPSKGPGIVLPRPSHGDRR
jgi:transposase